MKYDYSPDNREKAEAANELIQKLIAEVEKVVLGKHNEIVMLVTAMLAGGHVLIEDVPGVGKTTLAAALSKACGLNFNRAQFTPDVMASDITGFNIYNRAKEEFEFKKGLVMCNVLLADEINRASPKTQSALLEAMEEGAVTVDGTTYKMPKPFMVIATQNPTGYIGTYPLPEAQLDRFVMRLSMGYPTQAEEMKLIADRQTKNPVELVTPITDAESLNALRELVSNVRVSAEISKFIDEKISVPRQDEMPWIQKDVSFGDLGLALPYKNPFPLGIQHTFAEDAQHTYDADRKERRIRNPDAVSKKKILVFHDSFFISMEPYFHHYFQETHQCAFGIDFDLIDRERPDVVVWEIVERFTRLILL